ncbi:MAG: ABC transporter ATP-binding protein [Anaerolineales bacterium]|nr:ABC transporter ATP-binding protein [Anaerolineales bacterium]MCS7248145.1 ABC transporter ATP-binding protein [Anaerolineales bacterium]MDW8161957.1 ABC transporter ATP-binding protein [Anaerolineales bacterium]MDW8447180.1 ABC transporter ATP-binding protein [Anaerolineales bacterium]
MSELLRLEKMRKTFPGVLANDDIDLSIEQGEIHALLGENGAGKTTLMNCVYGVYRPDRGRIFWKGKEVTIHQARDAIALGIGMVHQHFMLVPPLTVAENVILGLPSPREPLLDIKAVEKEVEELSQRYGLAVNPSAQIWQLPVGVQQRVEILKALYRKAELLILDEPTAVLTPIEVDELFAVLKSLKEKGISVIFISHKLEEVMKICDRITVLRDGRKIATLKTTETTPRELAKMMVGREVFLKIDKPPLKPGEIVLKVEALSAKDNRGLPAVRNVSFEVRRYEILGIAGVDGNGQAELADVLSGMRRASSGRVEILGKDVTDCTPLEIINHGVAYIPPDRQHTGLILDFTVAENLVGKSFFKSPLSKWGILRRESIEEFAQQAIQEYGIRTPGAQVKAKLLSGGNQQKVVLARELSGNPDLIIASQPTRGLDVGATEYVRTKMVEARNRGAAILLISTELEEVLTLSDRIAVMYGGEIVGIVPADQADIHEIGEMMAGTKRLVDGTLTLKIQETEKAYESSD